MTVLCEWPHERASLRPLSNEERMNGMPLLSIPHAGYVCDRHREGR
jgi:hypothetical protein